MRPTPRHTSASRHAFGHGFVWFTGLLGVATLALSCASGPHGHDSVPPSDQDDPAARAAILAPALDGYHAAFLLTWDGRRIGEARERFFAEPTAEGGYRFERTERVIVRREAALSTSLTRIQVDVDPSLHATHVRVDREAGRARTRGEAVRLMDDGWRVTYGGSPSRIVDGNAVPSTLVPILVAARGISPGRAFAEPVLIEGSALAFAKLTVDISADRRVASADFDTAAGPLHATARLDDHGFIASAGEGARLQSRRADEDELAASFQPPEIVASSSVPVTGSGSDAHHGLHLLVSNVKAPVPMLPEVTGQRVTLVPGGAWDVEVDAPEAIGGMNEVRERTDYVSRSLIDDLAQSVLTPEEALSAGRGDCTAHAVVLKKLLEDRGYQVQLVTGFILEDGALRRHRWVAVKVNHHWVQVDPMFDEAPAKSTHVALAVTGSSADELAFVDDVAFAGWDGAQARYAE